MTKHIQQQLELMPNKCRKLKRSLAKEEKFVVIDDEKYVTFLDNMHGNAGFYHATNKPDVRSKCKGKFTPKVLVWLELSNKGVSAAYIGKTNGPEINVDVYRQNC